MKRVFYFSLPEAFGLFYLFLFATPSYAALTRQDDRFAHGGDRWRAAALLNRRSRANGHSAARLCGNFAHVETDHPVAGGEVYRDRAGPTGHR